MIIYYETNSTRQGKTFLRGLLCVLTAGLIPAKSTITGSTVFRIYNQNEKRDVQTYKYKFADNKYTGLLIVPFNYLVEPFAKRYLYQDGKNVEEFLKDPLEKFLESGIPAHKFNPYEHIVQRFIKDFNDDLMNPEFADMFSRKINEDKHNKFALFEINQSDLNKSGCSCLKEELSRAGYKPALITGTSKRILKQWRAHDGIYAIRKNLSQAGRLSGATYAAACKVRTLAEGVLSLDTLLLHTGSKQVLYWGRRKTLKSELKKFCNGIAEGFIKGINQQPNF